MTSRKLVRGLFSGASLFAIAVGAATATGGGVANAEVINTQVNTTKTAPFAPGDFLEITSSGSIVTSGAGVVVPFGESPEYIVNDGLIDVDASGPFAVGVVNFFGTVEGDVTNNGDIIVDDDSLMGGNAFFGGVVLAELGDDEQTFLNTDLVSVAPTIADDANWVVGGGVAVVGANFVGDYTAILDNDSTGDINVTVISNDASGWSAGIGLGGIAGALGENATAEVFNDGDVNVDVNVGTANVLNDEGLGIGFGLGSFALGETAVANIDNTSNLTVDTDVIADDEAIAGSIGYAAVALGFGSNESASSLLDNSGTSTISATAESDNNSFAGALGGIQLVGAINQSGQADGTINNSGATAVTATATSDDTNFGFPDAISGASGYIQAVGGGYSATALIDNSGDLTVTAESNAIGDFDWGDPFALAIANGTFQLGAGGMTSDVTLINSGNSIDVTADAFAAGNDPVAVALGLGFGQVSLAGDNANATMNNTGSFSVEALSVADAFDETDPAAGDDAYAFAGAAGGFQFAFAGDETATTAFTNSSNYNVVADAYAEGVDEVGADAIALGLGQASIANLDATTNFTNEAGGSFTVEAWAEGYSDDDDAEYVNATAIGLVQFAASGQDTALANGSNAGTIAVAAGADAQSNLAQGDNADADATAIGVVQIAASFQTATSAFLNEGLVDIDADAFASSDDSEAGAFAGAFEQDAFGLNATTELTNSATGAIDVDAVAIAETGERGDNEEAVANAGASGVVQFAGGVSTATLIVQNDGGLSVTADASASTIDDLADAYANAWATGVDQLGLSLAGSASATTNNTGSLTVEASASAETVEEFSDADADAGATGVRQYVDAENDAVATFNNASTGSLSVTVDAMATSELDDAYVNAYATGVDQQVFSDLNPANAIGTNDGTMTVALSATADAFEEAYANGTATGVHQYVQSFNNDASANFANNASLTTSNTVTATSEEDIADADSWTIGIYQEVDDADRDGVAMATNADTATLTTTGKSEAVSINDDARAYAATRGIYQDVRTDVDAVASAFNGGTLTTTTESAANSQGDFGDAWAYGYASGIYQIASGFDGVSEALAGNAGTMTVTSTVAANSVNDAGTADDAYATAEVYAIEQFAGGPATDSDVAITDIDNSGTINFAATGTAIGDDEAYANAFGTGFLQVSESEDDAQSYFTNEASGVISGSFIADAAAIEDADADVDGAGGYQYVLGYMEGASADFANAGSIEVRGEAIATSQDDDADANSIIYGQIQYVETNPFVSPATATMANTGSLTYTSLADAMGDDVGSADATAFGLMQVAMGYEATTSITNSGSVYVGALGIADGDDAYADANAFGAIQAAVSPVEEDGEAAISFDNSNLFEVYASAEATGTTVSDAEAVAIGVLQFAIGSEENFTNSADFIVGSTSVATGPNAFADADATGVIMVGDNNGNQGDHPLNVAFFNTVDGNFVVTAQATAEPGDADAIATGLFVADLVDAGVTGEIVNNGTMFISAESIASPGDEFAEAWGIVVTATTFDGVIYNDGLLDVEAVAEEAYATGIYVETDDGDPSLVWNDGGTIIARTLTSRAEFDSSASAYMRGTAIDVHNTVSEVSIDLTGGDDSGKIFGNIALSANDEVNVFDGTTYLNGVVYGLNPGDQEVFVAQLPLYTPDIDLDVISAPIIPAYAENYGDLNVLDGGTLVLVSDRFNGPSGAVVENFTQQDGGTLGLNIQPASAPFINATNVSLDGDAVVLPEAGLYANVTVYEDVVASANPIVGEWDNVTSVSPLLSPEAVFDGPNNIDLVVERVGFGDVAGLTKNQSNVGDGIENVYEDVYNGLMPANFTNLVSQLFTLNNAQYADALNQLSGAEYAQQIQSALWSFRLLNNAVGERLRLVGPNDNCAVADYPAPAAAYGSSSVSPVADLYVPAPAVVCAPNKAQIWAKVTGQWSSDDGDRNGPKYDQDTYAIYGGVDWGLDPVWKIGLTGGYISADMDFKRNFKNKIDYDGLQIAGYGAYDNGTNYAHGILGYGHYWNDSRRKVAFGGGTYNPFDQKPWTTEPDGIYDSLKGKWTSDVLSIYGETGYRFWMSETTAITPFLSANYVKVWNDSFTEKSATNSGAALRVKSNDGDSFNTQLGARFSTKVDMGNGAVFVPELRAAWQHEWLDRAQTASMSFFAAPGSNFTVVGTRESRDFAVVGAGATFNFNENFDFMVDYDGRFSSKHDDHSVVGRVTYKF